MATPAFCIPATNAVFFEAVRRLQDFQKVDKTLQSLLAVDAPFVAWKTFNIKKLAKRYKDVPEVKDDVEKLLMKIEKQRKKEENQRMHENRRLRAMEQKDPFLGSAPEMRSIKLKEPKLALKAPLDVTKQSSQESPVFKNLRTVIPTSQNVTEAKKIRINTASKPVCTLAAPSVRIPKRPRPSDHQGTIQDPQNNSNPQEDQKTSDGQKTTHDARKYSNSQMFPQPLFQSAAQRLSQLDGFEAEKFQSRMEAELRRANGEGQPMCKKMKLGV